MRFLEEKLIANLFADDTTTFLSENDSIGDLESILSKWCKASTVKFNIQKTEIIPIGTEDYRKKVIEHRKISENGDKIPEDRHIVKDGEAVRILGAWMGKKVEVNGIWAPLVEKIDMELERWEKVNPTIEGRKLIVQMVVGGMTQYLTNVQKMTGQVEKRLTKRIRHFLWGERKCPQLTLKHSLPQKL